MTEFIEVYKLYFRDVYRYALTLSGDELLAEEITQETFFKALSNLEKFDGKCKVSVWLCQIAKNSYLSMRRKDKHFDRFTDFYQIPAQSDIEEQYADSEMARYIYDVLRNMDEPYKEVFMLRTIGELPYKRIGELFGKTENWARVTYHRARIKIREELK